MSRKKQSKLLWYLYKANVFIQFVMFNKVGEFYYNTNNLSELELKLSKLKNLLKLELELSKLKNLIDDNKLLKPIIQDEIKIRVLIIILLTNLKKIKR